MEARDARGNLICPVPGCGAVIRAFTGFQELGKLRDHYRRKHRVRLSPGAALEIRADHETRSQAEKPKRD